MGRNPVDLLLDYGITTVIDRSPDREKELRDIPCLKIKHSSTIEDLLRDDLYLWGHIFQLADIGEAEKLSEIAHVRE